MRLGFDIDGVWTDLAKKMVDVAAVKFGKTINPSDLYQDDRHGLTREELDAMFVPEFFYDMEPLAENIRATQELIEDGHEIHVVTARPESDEMFEATIGWLQKHKIPEVDSFTFHHEKAKVAFHLKLQTFVEDFSSNANELSNVMGHVYLINQPYNLKDNLSPNVIRVNNVWEVRRNLQKELLASAA